MAKNKIDESVKGEVVENGFNEANENEMSVFENREVTINLADLRDSTNAAYCSLPANTREEKLAMFGKTQNPDKNIEDCINLPIKLVDVFVEVIMLEDGSTAPRILLFDEKGTSYQSVSFGMFNNLKKLFALIGEPHYNEPVPIVVKKVKTKRGSTYSLDIAL